MIFLPLSDQRSQPVLLQRQRSFVFLQAARPWVRAPLQWRLKNKQKSQCASLKAQSCRKIGPVALKEISSEGRSTSIAEKFRSLLFSCFCSNPRRSDQKEKVVLVLRQRYFSPDYDLITELQGQYDKELIHCQEEVCKFRDLEKQRVLLGTDKLKLLEGYIEETAVKIRGLENYCRRIRNQIHSI